MRSDRRKRLGLAAGALGAVGVLVAGVPMSASAGDQQNSAQPAARAACTPHELPVPGDIGVAASVIVVDADPSGRYVLGEVRGFSTTEALVWLDGELEARVPALPGSATVSDFAAVNGSGVVVGMSPDAADPAGKRTAWKYEDGEQTALQGVNRALDINENGDILGTRNDERTAVSPGGDPAGFQDLPGEYIAADMSEEGVVIGPGNGIDDVDAPYDGPAYYWADWTSERQTLQNPDGVANSLTDDIAGDWVIGHDADDANAGIRWNLADGSVEQLPYHPTAVNSVGDVGTEVDANTQNGAIYRADGSVLELPAPGGVYPKPSVGAVSEPGSSITAAGQYDPSEDTGLGWRPLTWTC